MSPHLRPGIIAAVAALVLDQASKLWLLFVFDIGRRGAVKVTPFFDLVLAWNVGISFGWFQNDGFLAQAILTAIRSPTAPPGAVRCTASRTGPHFAGGAGWPQAKSQTPTAGRPRRAAGPGRRPRRFRRGTTRPSAT